MLVVPQPCVLRKRAQRSACWKRRLSVMVDRGATSALSKQGCGCFPRTSRRGWERRRAKRSTGRWPALVFELIQKHGIACEAVRNGTLHCAHAPSGLWTQKERRRQLWKGGAPVQLLTAEETRSRTGAAGFQGALLDRRTGTIQPLAHLRGLARAAVSAGAKLYESAPVSECRHVGGSWHCGRWAAR